MTVEKVTNDIEDQKEELRKLIEDNSNIQAKDILELSREIDELIKKYYLLKNIK
ncbi:MAG TPA: Spo0E family sporulation regulatory protein-aspartic acid phosphatase [Eubacteriaceae bacterium]|jgi:hypothetical protein|nr:Spo0E family sporulation regulatory protein-aspartic acid phosphatase [Eubacteriaceae bacterium]